PKRSIEPAVSVVAPRAVDAQPVDVPDASDDLRAVDHGRVARRSHALIRARLRRAKREARLYARRHGTPMPMLPDADGVAVPLDVWAQGERFATAAPVDLSDLAEPLGGSQGSVSFWFRPQWGAGSQDDASFLEIGDGFVRVVKNVDFVRFEFLDAN